jgi:hypothetical protein
MALADIYWGKWGGPTLTGQTMTGSQILANLSGASGYVGLVSPGRLYNFPSTPTQMYFWWCIPNYANDGTNGDKIIRYVIQLGNSVPNYTSLKSSTTPYTNRQVNPTPTPAIYYAIVPINGIDYRVYRSNSAIAGGAALNQYVVSY